MNGFQRSKVADELAEKISPFFSLYEIQQHDDKIYFFGLPKKISDQYMKNCGLFLLKRALNSRSGMNWASTCLWLRHSVLSKSEDG
jgi:hypothetical protein